MITYEEAKKIALEHIEVFGAPINTAGELPEAYVFDDSEHEYVGWIPFAVLKEDGSIMNLWHYIYETKNITYDDIKVIPF